MVTYKDIIAGFWFWDKLKKSQFFAKIFLLANNKKKIVFEILFLIFSNGNICFEKKKLVYRGYIVAKALLIILKDKFID